MRIELSKTSVHYVHMWRCRYVIGQDNVKMALSVAVHNHYMRLYSKERQKLEVQVRPASAYAYTIPYL